MIIFDELLRGKPSAKPGSATADKKASSKNASYGSGGGGRNRVLRVASKSPEVMVKVSGYSRGVKHLKAHLEYITRNGDVHGETDRGDQILSRDDVHYLHREWSDDLGRRKEGKTRDSAHIILSMPPGHDPESIYESAKEFAKEAFGNHQYLAVLHTDEKHPHVHLAVKTLGYDGKRLHIKKGDPQNWREQWAEKLRDRGMEAEATPRTTRGVVRKPARQDHLHMRQEGRTPEVYKERAKEALNDNKDDRPWEQKIHERQKFVRAAWQQAESEMRREGKHSDADNLANFQKAMPKIETQRDLLRAAVSDAKQRQVDRTENDRETSRGDDGAER